jgi:hypothetical protein
MDSMHTIHTIRYNTVEYGTVYKGVRYGTVQEKTLIVI